MPALLPADELQQGNALASGTTQLSTLAGPALGGIVVAVAGASAGFVIDAVSFVISATTLAGVRSRTRPSPTASAMPHRAGAARPDADADDGDGDGDGDGEITLRSLLASEPILTLMLATDAIVNLCSTGMARVALPALTKGAFHSGAEGYGALLGAFGAGLLLGTIAGVIVPQVRRPLLSSSLALLVAVPLIGLLPYLGGPIPAGAALLVSAVLIAFGNILFTTAFQQWAPPQLMGRLTALLLLASVGMLPVSVLLAGVLVDGAGAATYFPLAAGTVIVAAALQLSSRTWRNFGATSPPGRTDRAQLVEQ